MTQPETGNDNTVHIELILLNSIRLPEHMLAIAKAGVTEEDFLKYRDVFNWIQNYVREFGKIPTQELVQVTFSEYRPETYVIEVDEIIRQLKKKSAIRKAKQFIVENIKDFDEKGFEAIERLSIQLSSLQNGNGLHMSYTDRNMGERLDQYMGAHVLNERAIPTGFDFLDKRRTTWVGGEFSAFVARTFVGKSWSLIYTGVYGWIHGAKIIFVSPELGVKEGEKRFDVLAGNLMKIPVTLSDIRYRNMASVENYQRLTQEVQKREDWITIDSINGKGVTPGRLHDLVVKLKPDMILIDGINFIGDDNRARDGWERIYNVSRDIKQIASIENIVVLTVQQVKPACSPFRVPSMEDIAYSDGFVQTMDRIITVSLNEDDSKFRDYTVQKDRILGEVLTERAKTEFEPEIGKIGRRVF